MKTTQKTTVYLDWDDYQRLKSLARRTSTKPAALVREAVAAYVVRHAPARRPRSFGRFASGRPDLGERSEDLLAGMGRHR